MHVDIVKANDEWVAIYLDGILETWDNNEPFVMLEESLAGRYPVAGLATHDLGQRGLAATCFQDPPDRFEDIPEAWWTDLPYDHEEDPS
jgi:hypothetical protein